MDISRSHSRVYGVDFSGAVLAGRKIWIAGGREERGVFRIASCLRAAGLPGGAPERAPALAALRAFIAAQTDAVFGVDVPFGIPLELMDAADWRAFACSFATRYPDAGAFRTACGRPPDGREPRRLSDREARTPFAPANLRLYRQTYHGIRDLLAPLLTADSARVLPMQAPAARRAVVVEICPATTVRVLGRFGPYKGRTADHRGQRAAILGRLGAAGLAELPRAIAEQAVMDTEGDALDSIVAAWTTWRLLPRLCAPLGEGVDRYRAEGYVYTVRTADIPLTGS